MHLSLHHHPSYSTIAVEGGLDGLSADGVLDAFSLVPPEQSLVLDLSQARDVDWRAARLLTDEISERSRVAHVVVVVDGDAVSSALVATDLHRWVPFVHRIDDAVTLVTGVVTTGV